MNPTRLFAFFVPLVFMMSATRAQIGLNPGGFGDVHMDPAANPSSVTIGDDTTVGDAALSVHAHELVTPPTTPIPGGGTWFELLRTTVPAGNNGRWRMFRGLGEMGRIYNTNPGQGFHIQSTQANARSPAYYGSRTAIRTA